MSETPIPLPSEPSLEQLKKQAKDRVRKLRATGNSQVTLADAQFAIAREYGFINWSELKSHIETHRPGTLKPLEELASGLALAYTSSDERTVRQLNANFGTSFPTDFHDSEKMRQCLRTWYADEQRTWSLALSDARKMVAHAFGLESWLELAANVSQERPDKPSSALVRAGKRAPFYRIDWANNRLHVRGPQNQKDWQEMFSVIKEHQITNVEACGIDDDAMKSLAKLTCITHLDVSGSQQLTDEGAQYLADMPQLVTLEIGGTHTALGARAFEPLRKLKQLRNFKSCWTAGFTDQAAAQLESCEWLESVNVLGSNAGDGLIRALAGKLTLRFLETGRGVTDDGIRHLHKIAAFGSAPQTSEVAQLGLVGESKLPNKLTIDGPFTDAGLTALEGLDGVVGLSFFWHSKAFTAAGLRSLRRMQRLEFFGVDGDQCGDEAMEQIAAIPTLRQLQAQGAIASSRGWLALGGSQTLEYIWGRECPSFDDNAFQALAEMPSLRGFGISCEQISDEVLSLLPRFLSLRQLISIGISDAGFRHIGKCRGLDSLYCMYCRDTGDAATEHIKQLENLETYYAGMTQITDRSLQLLSRMDALKKLEFWQCMKITDDGVAHLAELPRLQRLDIHGSPGVTRRVETLFRDDVDVCYSG
jgi:hypothetical protein